MANIGASKPLYAKYNHSGGVVSYSDGGVMGALVEFNIELEAANDNDFYADNAVKETSRNKFSSGTIGMQTDDLRQSVSKAILGLKEENIVVPGIEDPVTELVYDADQNTPYLGIGMIQKKQVDNVNKYRAILLKKVMFSVPADAATTEGEEIDWQVPELSGKILRDDTAKKAWKCEATFDTEAEAEIYLRYKLGITAGSNADLSELKIGTLTLTPEFDPDETNYTVSTSNATNAVSATPDDENATFEIRVNGSVIESGSSATWNAGSNTVTVKVTAADGVTTKTYEVTVTKS